MEENINVMNQLLQKCGKEPNQEQKKTYYKAIYQMLTEEGFTDIVQEYMNKGFKFVKMGPFKAYFIRQDDSEKDELLKKLFESDFLTKDKLRAFSILINLLALFISSNVDYRYSKSVLKEIPNYCCNKEGKIFGNANGLMLNNFYSDLTVVPNNFVYGELFESEDVRVQFEELLTNSIAYASTGKKLTTRQKDAIEMAREWLPEENITCTSTIVEDFPQVGKVQNNGLLQGTKRASSAKSVEQDASSEQDKNARKDIPVSNSNISKNGELHDAESIEPEQLPDNVLSADNRLPAFLDRLIHRIDRLDLAVEKSNENTADLIKAQQSYIDDLKATIEMEKANSDLIRRRNIEFTEEIRSLKKKVEDLRNQLLMKEEENRSLNGLLEVSSKEGDRKFRGEILKLTEKLRFEYQDYMSAQNIPMSIDLGENMRGQLGDVFSILKKAGLDIDSR